METRSASVELLDPLSQSYFEVTVHYYSYSGVKTNLNHSIESYDLEGDNLSREELVERFGEEEVKRLEGEIDS